MSKVTRIIYSQNLNEGKLAQLTEMASRLGKLRAEVWQRFGSVQGVELTHRQIRNQWTAEGRHFNIAARLRNETLRDTFADIVTYREAAKVKVRKAIRQRTDDNDERKRLYTLLKYDNWLKDSYLRRMMRKYFKHGKTKVDNQIVLDSQCYTTFEKGGKIWLKVMSLESGKRIAIPLNSNNTPSGTLRLILRNGRIEVHYAIDEEKVCVTRPSGDGTIGIDKGYTEVFVDSDGKHHGEGLGELLSKESDYLKTKYQRRNKLKAIAEAKPHKCDNILKNNLGRKKLDERKRIHTANVRDKIFKAAHSVVDKADIIVTEDLTNPINGKSYGKNQNRRLAGWTKGAIAEAIESVSNRRGSTIKTVNAAYTSQTDSRHGILLGHRNGDRFYCFDGKVLQADTNAARNILARLNDPEIRLFTPYKDVKVILLARTGQFERRLEEKSARLGLLNQDTSYVQPRLFG
jgi:IS605 OrfB family transposase